MKQIRHTILLSVLAALFLCSFGPALTARADVIYEPEDSFYQSHSSECPTENRYYIANSPQDKLYLLKSPENNTNVNSLENGTKFFVYNTYTDKDGRIWGYTEPTAEISASGKSGWANLDFAYVAYDSIEFLKDYETVQESGTAAIDEDHPNLCIWDYPGGEITANIDTYGEAPGYSRTFTDEEGRKWGYASYYVGWRNFWFLIDEPGAAEEEVYPNGKPVRDTRQVTDWTDPQNVPEPVHSTPAWVSVAVIVIPVAAVVAVCALALWLLKKNKKK